MSLKNYIFIRFFVYNISKLSKNKERPVDLSKLDSDSVYLKKNYSFFGIASLERRWSSRWFPNGYLVTTSPQLSAIP